jgi:hypothetical protein
MSSHTDFDVCVARGHVTICDCNVCLPWQDFGLLRVRFRQVSPYYALFMDYGVLYSNTDCPVMFESMVL